MYQSLNNLVKHYIKLIVNVIDKKPSTTKGKSKQEDIYIIIRRKIKKKGRNRMEWNDQLYNIKTR